MSFRRYTSPVPGIALSVGIYRFPDCRMGIAFEVWRTAYFFEWGV